MADLLSTTAQNRALDAVVAVEMDRARLFAREVHELVALGGLSASEQDYGEVVQFAQLELAGSCRLGQGTATIRLLQAERLVVALPLTLRALEQGALFAPGQGGAGAHRQLHRAHRPGGGTPGAARRPGGVPGRPGPAGRQDGAAGRGRAGRPGRFGGTALYLATFGYTRWMMFRLVSKTRLAAAGVVLVLLPTGHYLPALASLIGLAAVVAVLNVVEHLRNAQIGWRAVLNRRRASPPLASG